ncbi:MAG: DedA family protein [Ornithinibacter sp.]
MLTSLLERLLDVPAPVVLAVVGALVFAEDALFFGFVIPGETVAILGGVSASLGHVPLWAMLTVVIVAAIVGDSVGFEVGRRLGPWLMATRPLARHADRLDDARDLLARRGGSAVLLGRWVAFFRAVMPALAGSSDMRYRTFLTWNAIGGILWGTVVVMGGYLAGASYQAVADALGTGSAVLVGVAAVLGFIVWRLRRRRSDSGAVGSDSPDAGSAPADVPAGPASTSPTD